MGQGDGVLPPEALDAVESVTSSNSIIKINSSRVACNADDVPSSGGRW
jgi:hypothetical protein